MVVGRIRVRTGRPHAALHHYGRLVLLCAPGLVTCCDTLCTSRGTEVGGSGTYDSSTVMSMWRGVDNADSEADCAAEGAHSEASRLEGPSPHLPRPLQPPQLPAAAGQSKAGWQCKCVFRHCCFTHPGNSCTWSSCRFGSWSIHYKRWKTSSRVVNHIGDDDVLLVACSGPDQPWPSGQPSDVPGSWAQLRGQYLNSHHRDYHHFLFLGSSSICSCAASLRLVPSMRVICI